MDQKRPRTFDTWKHRLINPPISAYPLFDLPLIVDTDASDTGLDAVLQQIQEGKERVIAYGVNALTKPPRNYSTSRKELLPLVWGLEHFEVYLLGTRFRARTDHNALRWLRSFKEPKDRLPVHRTSSRILLHHRTQTLALTRKFRCFVTIIVSTRNQSPNQQSHRR